MTRILFITGEIHRSFGTGEYIYNLMSCLISKGFNIHLVTKKTYHDTNLRVKVIEAPSTLLNIPKTFKFLTRLLHVIRQEPVDIVHVATHSYPNLALGLLITLLIKFNNTITRSKSSKIRLIITVHDKIFPRDVPSSFSEWILYYLMKIAFNFVDLLTVPGESIKDTILHLFGRDAYDKALVLPVCIADDMFNVHNINEEDIRTKSRAKHGLPLDALVVSFFGSIDFKPNLISAFWLWKYSRHICRELQHRLNRQVIIIIAGRHSEKLPRDECYIPIGYVEHLVELFALSDIIVIPHFPSHSGPHVKTLYSVLSRKPVIVTKEGIKDLPLSIEKCVYLLEYLNHQTLIATIERILANEGENYIDDCIGFLYSHIACTKLCNLYDKVYKAITR
ncbi:MAG: glycosyltransferase [Desulfurococcaceae archaeon]